MAHAETSELPKSAIDRASPVPFYFQLARALRGEIVSGRWRAGDRLVSEPAMCKHFDVSRSTVRQALQSLEAEGLIRREKGRGTFVADSRPGSWLLQSAGGFFHEEADRMGFTVTSKVIRAEIERLPKWATEALQLPPGSEGVTLERLRSIDGRVALYVVNHLPQALAETALTLEEDSSLYGLLEDQAGIRVVGGRRSVEAIHAGKQLGQLLDVDSHAPIAFIESVSWGPDGEPFDCYRAWLRTDRLRIDIVVASGDTDPSADGGPTSRADHFGIRPRPAGR